MKTRIAFITLLLISIGLFGVYAAEAANTCHATHDDGTTVFSSADASAIQQAVNSASSGTTVRVAGTCTGTQIVNGTPQLLYIDKSLSIYGGYDSTTWLPLSAAAQSTLDANRAGRIIYINGVDVLMGNIVMQNGNFQGDGGGIFATDGDLDLSNVTVRDSITGDDTGIDGGRGGGIFIRNGDLDLSDSLVTQNSSTNAGGGGIAAENGDISITGGAVSHNFSTNGDGGGVAGDKNITIVSAEIHNNRTVFGSGGGIYSRGSLTISDSTLAENGAGEGSGGALFNVGQLSIDSTQILSHTASYAAGSLLHASGDGRIENVVMRNGSGESSGHIHNSGSLIIRDSTLIDGRSTFGAGAIHNTSVLTIEANTTIANSFSLDSAGGIFNSGTLDVNGSTIHGIEVSHGLGRGALLNVGSAEITNSTISNNSSPSAPSIAGIDNRGTITLTNTTISDNSTTTQNGQPQNGIGFTNSGTATLINTIIANSSGGSDCAGGATLTNTLIEDGSCGATLTGDPLLGALADNGGATQTHALLEGSPAINAGSNAQCPETDQRGEPRNVGACDIGAFEVQEDAPPDGCFATPDHGVTVFSSVDGAAVQQAIDAAGSFVKLAGHCLGTGGAGQMIFLITAHTLEGGYSLANWKSADFSNPTILDAAQQGRLIDHRFETSTLRNVILRNGAATSGGAVLHSGGVLTLERVQISNNVATEGAGIYATGKVIVRDSTINENTAADFGGGLFVSATGELVLERSLLLLNKVTSGGSGGAGLYNGGLASVQNSTFSGNDARVMTRTRGTAGGGAIFNNGGTLTLRHATIADNFADDNGYAFGGGIHNNNGGTLYLHNTIVANNLGGNCVNRALLGGNSGSLINGSRNLACVGMISADPQLNLLADNGGATKTYALAPTSPAINAASSASCLAIDQRGVARPQGADCDIGAFEYEGVPTAVGLGGFSAENPAIPSRLLFSLIGILFCVVVCTPLD